MLVRRGSSSFFNVLTLEWPALRPKMGGKESESALDGTGRFLCTTDQGAVSTLQVARTDMSSQSQNFAGRTDHFEETVAFEPLRLSYRLELRERWPSWYVDDSHLSQGHARAASLDRNRRSVDGRSWQPDSRRKPDRISSGRDIGRALVRCHVRVDRV
jgi:hypothetical protein